MNLNEAIKTLKKNGFILEWSLDGANEEMRLEKFSEYLYKVRELLVRKGFSRGKQADNYDELHDIAHKYCRLGYSIEDCANKIIKDIKRKYIRYCITPAEYIDFRLFKKSKAEVLEYVSLEELLDTFSRSNRNLFPKDKYERYRLFSDFFHRDVIRIEGPEDKVKYMHFLEKNTCMVVKPIAGTKGHGVQILNSDDVGTIEALSEKTDLPVMIEQILSQGKELAAFHPSSINTLRVVTAINREGEVCVLFALLRVGQGESVVDNVGSGGLVCLIDHKAGIVTSDALYAHKYYKNHPDTGLKFADTRIPEWDRLIFTVKQAHESFAKQKLIGWDYAWTDHGWDLVEANPAPSFASYQTLSGKGIRPVLQEIMIL